jgi:hypothetical protein
LCNKLLQILFTAQSRCPKEETFYSPGTTGLNTI